MWVPLRERRRRSKQRCESDGVHFNGKGIAVHAEQVAKRISESFK